MFMWVVRGSILLVISVVSSLLATKAVCCVKFILHNQSCSVYTLSFSLIIFLVLILMYVHLAFVCMCARASVFLGE